jgi:hypothetical protein
MLLMLRAGVRLLEQRMGKLNRPLTSQLHQRLLLIRSLLLKDV